MTRKEGQRMATLHTDDMRRGTRPIVVIGRSASNTPRGAGDTIKAHAQEGTFGDTRAGNRSGNLGARSGTLGTARPEKSR
jgi:hypothetical protein